jgi:hypothetical protein
VTLAHIAKVGRVGGLIGAGIGIAAGVKHVIDAPPKEKGRVAVREVGGVLGGIAGGSAGVVLGSTVVAFCVGAGLISNPVGWAIGASILVGGVMGYLGSKSGSSLGNWASGKLGL